MLAMKMFGLQNVTDLIKARTDAARFGFLEHDTNHNEVSAIEQQEKPCSSQGTELYTNRRNMDWIINHLRVLQMLTKNKPHRVMLSVQYKSAVSTICFQRLCHYMKYAFIHFFTQIRI